MCNPYSGMDELGTCPIPLPQPLATTDIVPSNTYAHCERLDDDVLQARKMEARPSIRRVVEAGSGSGVRDQLETIGVQS